MPWNQTDPVNERLKFIAAWQEGLYSMTELCERFRISRDTGYKWVARYEAEGVEGLKDRSHAPQSCPHRMDEEVEAVLLATRAAHPTWGPRKILPYVAKRRPELVLPAASTVGDLFVRTGLVEPRRRRRRWQHPGSKPIVAEMPNQVWSADFKGEFRMGNGEQCYPLTVSDAHSRFLLVCHGLPSVAHEGARAGFERLFEERGLPEAIRTDNGVPFATTAIGGLSRLNIWWAQLGIRHDRIDPGRPDQNGRHERMHRTVKAETARPPQENAAAQQKRFDGFREEYNWERPHEALGQETPGSLYTPSTRPMPARIPHAEYPGHCLIRRVRKTGIFRFRAREIFLSELLKGHSIALEEVEDGVWSVYFYHLLLARLDERTFKLSG